MSIFLIRDKFAPDRLVFTLSASTRINRKVFSKKARLSENNTTYLC